MFYALIHDHFFIEIITGIRGGSVKTEDVIAEIDTASEGGRTQSITRNDFLDLQQRNFANGSSTQSTSPGPSTIFASHYNHPDSCAL